MSEEVLILNREDRENLEIILNICKKEFIRDKRAKREPLFNELILIKSLNALKLKSWVFGDLK